MDSELEVLRGSLGLGFVEDVCTKVNELSLAVEAGQELDLLDELKGNVVFVACLDLDVVALSILHLGQEAGLVLRSSGQSLLSGIATLKAGAWNASHHNHEVTSSSGDCLVLGVERLDVVVCLVVDKESVLVLMVQLLPLPLLLDLSQVLGYFPDVFIVVTSVSGVLDSEVHLDVVVQHAGGLDNNVVLKKALDLLDGALQVQVTVGCRVISEDKGLQVSSLGDAHGLGDVKLEEALVLVLCIGVLHHAHLHQDLIVVIANSILAGAL